jgi:hypothetical protein
MPRPEIYPNNRLFIIINPTHKIESKKKRERRIEVEMGAHFAKVLVVALQ